MKPGDVFPVSNSFSYALPKGLKEGTRVKLIAFDHGYWTVEADGQQFENVFATQIESGWLYELNGRWLDENDPRVIAERQHTSLRSSPARL